MTDAAVALTLASAAGHAYWNVLIKRAGASHTLVGLSKVTEGALMFPLLAGASSQWLDVSTHWRLPVVGAGLVLGNHLCTTLVYRHGQFSLMYPLTRGALLALVPPIAFAALGERLDTVGWLGISTIVLAIGVLHVPFRSAEFSMRGLVCAFGAAVFAACYTVWDKQAVAVLLPITYFASYTLLVGVFYASALALRSTEDVRAAWHTHRSVATQIAVLNAGSYVLVLVALQRGKASHVIALRQVSIAFGAVLAWKLLGESMAVERRIGIVLLLLGCVMLGFAR